MRVSPKTAPQSRANSRLAIDGSCAKAPAVGAPALQTHTSGLHRVGSAAPAPVSMNDDRWLLELDGRERAEGLEAELAGMRLEMQRLRELLSKKDAMIAQLLPAPQEVASGSSAASVLTPPNSTPDSFATEAGPPVPRQLSINASGEFPS